MRHNAEFKVERTFELVGAEKEDLSGARGHAGHVPPLGCRVPNQAGPVLSIHDRLPLVRLHSRQTWPNSLGRRGTSLMSLTVSAELGQVVAMTSVGWLCCSFLERYMRSQSVSSPIDMCVVCVPTHHFLS